MARIGGQSQWQRFAEQEFHLKRLMFLVSEDWYFVSHRLPLARIAIANGYRVAVMCRVSSHLAEMVQAGVEVIDWRFDRRFAGFLNEFRSVIDVWRSVARFKPDVVHAVALKPVLASALVRPFSGAYSRVNALGGLGFVFSSGRRMARLLRPVVKMGLRLALASSDSRLILQNIDDARILREAGIVSPEKIALIRGAGVDTALFAPTLPSVSDVVVALPARLLWDKGVGEFVSAARRLKLGGKTARFVLIGDRDSYNPACIALEKLQSWSEEGVIELWGRCSDMASTLARTHVVCLPSYREGLPKALLEAASCARPMVAFDVPGCREVVVHGETGFLVPFGDVGALADAIGRLIDDPLLRAEMGRAGRRKVLQEFSQERIANETMRIWEQVIA